MLRLRASVAIAMVLIFLPCCLGPASAAPQGEDPPGTDQNQPTAPPAQYKGVITPPQMGDEGIYTKVPNPEAGHEKEVIPPPGSPGGNPNVEPR